MEEGERVKGGMIMSKHTPGPWSKRVLEAENLSKTKFITARMGEIKIDICKLLFTSVLTLEEREANARLIASAPELLELLKAILGWDGILPHSRVRIKQAIAKAEEG